MNATRIAPPVRQSSGLLVLAVSLWLAGCASGVDLNDKVAPVENRTPTEVSPGGATSGTAQSKVASIDLAKSSDAGVSSLANVIYFDFDSYAVKEEFRPTVEAHAKALVANRKKKLSIEGHTDERGGREYNLALGQRRSEAVLKAMVLLGATDSQLEAVSFGKERPAAPGHDEAAWAKNRRAELVAH